MGDKQWEAEADDRREEDLQILAQLRLIDDDFARCVFRDRPDLVRLVLRVVTGDCGLEVATSETQYDLKWPVGARSLELDVMAVGADGTRYDLEVQRGKDPRPTRLRYHSACLDAEALGPGEDFSALPEQWVVFVMEGDPFGRGAGKYLFERRCGGDILGDGMHLLYANGAYRGDDGLGRLMHDFNQSDPGEMWPGPLADGVRRMCQIIEDMCREERQRGIEQGLLGSIRTLMETTHFSVQEIFGLLKVPKDDQPRYLAML